ncbi:MAG: glycine cleavage system protein GcvH [Phycisphaerales bacterium]|jgi:glycine cleavage system H protein|nr:glycine cleavage system protein GcvH [Phycisphaerales bacterium]
MTSPNDRRYTASHEWLKPEGDLVVIGITRFAVDQLTDVTYAELKPAGTKLQAGDIVAEVESVKTTSDVYTSVPGEIVEVNGALADDPGVLNSDPYGAGWLVKIRASDTAPLAALMDAGAYDAANPT